MADITNFLPVSDRLACAGQPDEVQLTGLAADGYEVVINLGLSDGKYALPDEARSVARLGLAYFHIPVLFESPQLSQLRSFLKIMKEQQPKKTLVHCAANYRATAFTGLYLFSISALDEAGLRSFLTKIWQPNPVWQEFIEKGVQHIEETRLRDGAR